jgi:Gpi18-like mannosyltransferase
MLRRISLVASFCVVMLLIYFAREINISIPKPDLVDQDIYYSYVEGKRLVDGENPYARILDGDMRKNRKYATYFPVFYELSFLSQKMGLSLYEPWIVFWQDVFMVFEFGIALLLYITLARNRFEWIGVFAATFWVFNRWTLRVIRLANLDFIPVFFLLLSLVIFSKNKWWGLFLLSLSLGFKQVAIFLAPLYLIWVWRQAAKDRVKTTLLAGLVIVSVPLISALPFLIFNARGFVMSVMFSATRSTTFGLGVDSLDVIAGWDGFSARFVMLALIGVVYFFALRGRGGYFFNSFLVMTIFLDFNTVLYSQYPCWAVPLLPLVFLELRDGYGNRQDHGDRALPA